MDSSQIVAEILRASGLTKAELSRRSGVSRALIDAYLKGKSQPSIAQINRLGDAGNVRMDIMWAEPIPRVPEALVLVVDAMEALGEYRGGWREKEPLINLGPIWRQAARQREGVA